LRKRSPEAAGWEPLPKSFKNRFPFKLSVPSFTYPGTWAANAEMLGPYVDEIELLFFESQAEGALPARQEIDRLISISEDVSVSYNIHLPTDVSLASPDRGLQAKAADSLRYFLDLANELNPSSFTLHIPYDAPGYSETDIKRWQERAGAEVEKLLQTGVSSRLLAVENLDYPFEWIRNCIREFDLSVCMDVGHLIVMGEDISTFYQAVADRVAVIHLHGVQNGKDHLPLTALPATAAPAVESILKRFSGTLSLEVFSYAYLVLSLGWMEKMSAEFKVLRGGRGEVVRCLSV